MEQEKIFKKYIVWTDFGPGEGWGPKSFDTWNEAVAHWTSVAASSIITENVPINIVDGREPQKPVNNWRGQ